MDGTPKPNFQSRCLASGLVSEAHMADALRSLQQVGPPAELTDEALAARLVALGPYRVIDSIGQGGMGQIFKAEHTLMGRIVAVKVLPRHRSSPEAIACFHREIRAQAQLDHESLVRALDAGHDGNVHYLVTEYVPGTDLRRLVRRHGPLDMATAASIISQAARGLSHAHAIGLIHRDVKPGNILVTPDGRTKVSDLGLADYFDATVVAATGRRGRIVGTADYLSPEQISAPESLTPASDVYSLGCTLYYAVTGKVPFPGGETRDKIYSHLNLQPIDPRRFNPHLSQEFVDVIAAMMAKKPQERIGTGEEVAERLAPWATASGSLNRTAVAAGWVQAAATDSSRFMGPPLGGDDSGELGETLPNFDFGMPAFPGVHESKSESQSTIPIVSAEEETRPSFDSREFFLKVRAASSRTVAKASEATGISTWLLLGIALAAVVAISCVVAIVLNLR
jgi:serine/threonine protein kinase